MGTLLVFCASFGPASAIAQDVAEQIRQLQEADRQRQAELEVLKASNQALREKLLILDGKAEKAADPANASANPPREDAAPTEGGLSSGGSGDCKPPENKSGSAGYNHYDLTSPRKDGFFIKSADDDWNLHIHNRLQMRYVYEHFNDRATRNGVPSFDRAEDRSDFHIAREYLTFLGNAWSKDLYYQITLEAFTANNENMRLRYDWIDFNVLHGIGWVDDYSPWRNALTFRTGIWKGRFGREFPANDGQLQFVDRSLATIAFNEGRIRGIELHGSTVYFKDDYNPEDGQTTGPGRLAYYLEVADSIDNATSAFNLDNNSTANSLTRGLDKWPSLTTRVQYDILRGWYKNAGPDGKVIWANDFRFNEADDLAYHEQPALQVGASYIFDPNDFDSRPVVVPPQGRYFKGKNIERYGADASFKYRGFSLTGEYYREHIGARPGSVFDMTNVLNPGAGSPILLVQRDSQISQGFYARSGIFLVPRRFEVGARVSGIFSDHLPDVFTPASGIPGRPGFRAAKFTPGDPIIDAWEYTVGMNYFPTGNHYLKLQVDFSYVTDNPISNEKGEFLSASHESDFILRTQLQVEF